MAGEQRVLRQAHARRGAVAEPFFGHEGRAKLAARGDRQMSGGVTVDDNGAGIFGETLAGERREELVLPIAGDASDPQDLAALQLQRDVFQMHAMWFVGREAEIIDHEPWHRRLPVGGGFHLLDLGADHHARQ